LFADLYDLRVTVRPYTAIRGSGVHTHYNSRIGSVWIFREETKRIHCPNKILKGPPWRHSPVCHNGFPDEPTYLFPSSIIRQCRLYSYRYKTAIVPLGSIYGAQHSCHVNNHRTGRTKKELRKKTKTDQTQGAWGNSRNVRSVTGCRRIAQTMNMIV
jgi:hypothetical protein